MKSIPLTGADVAEALAKYIDKQVSVNRKRVAEVMNVDELVCEVESLLLTLNEDYEVDPPEPEITSLKSKKKGWLVEKLIGLRNRLYKLDPEAKDHIAYLSKLRFEEENQPNVSLEEALALPIYQLSDEILNEARYSLPPDVEVARRIEAEMGWTDDGEAESSVEDNA